MKFSGRLLACAAVTSGLVWGSPALAQPQNFDVPAMAANKAIRAFAKQSGLDVIAPGAALRGVTTNPVKGKVEAEAALDQMFRGTSLKAKKTGAKSYLIKPSQQLHKISYAQPQSQTVDVPASPVASAADGQAVSQSEDFPQIVVTARRREESAQDVPIALTAIGGAQLEATNTIGLLQVQEQVPSLAITAINPNNTNVNIRGLGANAFLSNIGLENGVGVHVDGVYLARPAQSTFELVDLDRIEILRGPQGTLFGKNTTAGAINIVTRLPSFDFEAGLDASYGNYDYYQVRGTLSGPISDTLAARVSLSQTERGGFIDNVRTGKKINDFKSRTARGQLLFKPSDTFSLRLIADYSDQNSKCCANTLARLVTTRVDGSALPNGYLARAARVGYTSLPFAPFLRKNDTDSAYIVDQKQYGFSAEMNLDLGDHRLTSITSLRKWKYDPETDADGIGLAIFDAARQVIDDQQFTQELRFASTGKRTVDYVLGLYYYDHDVDVAQLTQYGADSPDFVLGGANAVTVAALNGFGVVTDSRLRAKSYAAFGQATWNVSEAFSITGGLRFNHETKRGVLNQTQAGGADLSLLPDSVAGPALGIRNQFGRVTAFSARTREQGLTGQINLAYKVTPDVMVYATYARGSKSGGINMTNLPVGVAPTIRPEKVNHYEVGLKSTLLDRKLTLNAALFQTQIGDYQTTILDADRSASYLQNAGKVRSRGFEVESWLRPARGLSLRAAVTYVDAELRSFKNAPCPIEYFQLQTICDLSGTRLPGAPKWAMSLGGEYTASLNDALQAYVGADYSYRSSVFTSSNAARATLVPGYGLVNARVGVKSRDGQWDASLWARNLFDKNYFTSLTVAGFNSGAVTGLVGDPGTYGLTVRFRY